MLSDTERSEIEEELAILPQRRSGVIEALKTVQRHRGWIDDEAVADVADFLDMSAGEVDSVATFYNLLHRKPVGRHVIHLCDSVTCWILGCDVLRRSLGQRLGIGPGETTPDGRFTLLPIQCLGACDHAPALMIDEDLHRDVTGEDLEGILQDYD